MQINQTHNNPAFNGVLIKNITFPEVRNIAMSLRFRGFKPLGYKKYYMPAGTPFEMSSKARQVRQAGMKGIPNEFGTVYFPWRRTVYFIASFNNEKKIFNALQKIRPDVILDMFV